MKKLFGYYRFGGYQLIGEPVADNTVPRFSIFHARDQDDIFGRKPRHWLEERVDLVFPGALFCVPSFRVTDEHRKRWPKQYQAFRASLPLRTKFRLWWWAWRNPPAALEPHDVSLDVTFKQEMEKSFAERERLLDMDIGAALAAALRKEQEKAGS